MSGPLPSINKNANQAKPPKKRPEKVADISYEQWRQVMLYQIYGSQAPPTKTKRGRAV